MRRNTIILAALAAGFATHAGAAPAPTAPATSDGAYTVSYAPCSGCYTHWLEERVGSNGSWVGVGQGTTSFSGKADGTYYYRSAYLFWGADYSADVDYSALAAVVVGDDLPRQQTLPQQLGHRYEARYGDIDADGRTDLFIDRSAGGDGADGTLERLILRGTDAAAFLPLTPSASQAVIAGGWPVADIGIELRDINIDGFVDLILTHVRGVPGLSRAADQLIFAPGELLRTSPKAVRAMDSSLDAFASDVHGYLQDPDFFADTAPLVVVSQSYWDWACQYGSLDDWYLSSIESCYPIVSTFYYVLPDYSVFHDTAVDIWLDEHAIVSNSVTPDVGFARIEQSLEDLLRVDFGGWRLRELLGGGIDGIEPDARRGMELFSALAGIASANAQGVDGGDSAGSSDAVLIAGRRILGFGPFHTALMYSRSTVSAHDSDSRSFVDGILVSEVNWPNDHPFLLVRLGTVASTLGPALYWSRAVAADGRYSDTVPYDAVPSIGSGGYNSNSFVSGLIRATGGQPSLSMSRFIGGELPVPAHEFE